MTQQVAFGSLQAPRLEDRTPGPWAVPGYERLAAVFEGAYNQAARGKGVARHASGDAPFEEQSIRQITDLLESTDGLRFQAVKKIKESQRLKQGPAIAELYGAMVYLAAIVIAIQDQDNDGTR